MTKKNSTKKALITSALCLLLCVSMLVGATFAWFTDSVSTTNNIITAGNLDVNLYWSTDGDVWAPVEASTNVFKTGTLWEPGHTEVVYLKVVNEGTLALKYSLDVNVDSEVAGTNVAGESFKLSDYILYNIYEGVKTYADSAAARGNESGNKLNAPYNKAAQLLNKGESVELTMVVFMPSTVENEANYRGDAIPTINLGINLFATQYVKEQDSYGPDYDGSIAWNGSVDTAWYDANATEFVIGSAEQLAGFAKLVNEGTSFAGKTVKLDSNIDLANLPWTPVGNWDNAFEGTFNGNGYTVSNLYINDPAGEGIGFFGVVADATINGLTLENVEIDAYSMVAALVGAAYPANISDCHVTGDINVVAEWAYVGGIAGYCYYGTQVDGCSTIADGTGYLTSETRNAVGGITAWLLEGDHKVTNCQVKNMVLTGWTNVGGITGFVHYSNTIDGCSVEDVVLNKTRADGNPGIGLVAGGYSYSATNTITLSNNSAKNVTLNGNHVAYASYNELYGSEYGGSVDANFTLDNNTTENITNNLAEVTKASDAASLDAALKSGEDVVLGGNLKFNASATTANSGYGATGVSVFGNTLDGNGYSLGINDWGTWASAINITSGTVKNLTVNSGMRGIFINHNGAAGKVYLENVIVDGTVYTISCDQGTNNGLEATNCTFNGWTSYAATIGDVLFVDCSFGAGQGYNFSRPYAPTTYVGCDFAAGHAIDARAAITFENCTINGEPLTAENLATLVTGNIANATVIG